MTPPAPAAKPAARLRVLALADDGEGLAAAVRASGLEVHLAAGRRQGMAALARGVFDLCDARLAAVERPLEAIVVDRLSVFLDRLGDRTVPDLYRVVLAEVERGLLRAVLERSGGRVGRAARLLGLDRNTVARKARALRLAARGRGRPSRR